MNCQRCDKEATHKGRAWFDGIVGEEGFGDVYLCAEHLLALDRMYDKYPDAEIWDIPANDQIVAAVYWDQYPRYIIPEDYETDDQYDEWD